MNKDEWLIQLHQNTIKQCELNSNKPAKRKVQLKTPTLLAEE